ncbi:gamma-glutamyltransferase [Fimbriiglobus ruber]|uniref:Glutathione hydrolase proenzyme n=1 Tax=Fimbriiglobus ruber TaxID=1908690 RepID=A0A225DF18_9BACT|nr:gamma-glutamyltransferase [Fimbriiglobus ruber]OWK40151.1 Gamma-glutamyltranspeptidase [Fimbriiglobus ruber]
MPTMIDRRGFLTTTACALGAGLLPLDGRATGSPLDAAQKGLVTGQAEGAEAGRAVLAAGGNAVDAIVTAALVAGVVAVPGTGIAGYGGHLVIAKPDGQTIAIDFNSTAPAAITPNTFTVDENGNVKGEVNTYGWLAVGVPGVLAGLQRALDRFGTRSFAEVVKPAIRFAKDGFPVGKNFASAIKAASGRLAKDPGSAKLFFAKAEPLREGATYKNPDLGDLLQTLANRGNVNTFYKGDIADAVAAAFRKNGGLVTTSDLAAYEAREVKPLAVAFAGHTIYTPPPSSGGLTVLQTLAALDALGWSKWDAADPATTHAKVEALRVAWHDRLTWLGDPDYAHVPVAKLLSEKYAKATADRVRATVKAKKPLDGTSDGRPSGGTVHLNAIDAAGLTVALTFTHGGYFGANVTIDGLGLVLGHGVSRFDPRPGRANSPEPGKRPLHNMCPTVVTKDGKPVFALGATGGRRIVNAVFDVLAYRFGQSLPLAEAVRAPRVHTEGDTTLSLEAGWPARVTEYLKNTGYEVKTNPGAVLNAIERDPTSGALSTAAR